MAPLRFRPEDGGQRVRRGLALDWRSAGQHREQDAPEGPYVGPSMGSFKGLGNLLRDQQCVVNRNRSSGDAIR
jgi:hypothetical protein